MRCVFERNFAAIFENVVRRGGSGGRCRLQDSGRGALREKGAARRVRAGAVAVLPRHLRSGFKMSHILRLCRRLGNGVFAVFFWGGRGVLRGAVCARRAISGGLLVPSGNPFGRDGKGGIEIKATQSGFCPVYAERISVDTPRGVVVIFYGSAYARP